MDQHERYRELDPQVRGYKPYLAFSRNKAADRCAFFSIHLPYLVAPKGERSRWLLSSTAHAIKIAVVLHRGNILDRLAVSNGALRTAAHRLGELRRWAKVSSAYFIVFIPLSSFVSVCSPRRRKVPTTIFSFPPIPLPSRYITRAISATTVERECGSLMFNQPGEASTEIPRRR